MLCDLSLLKHKTHLNPFDHNSRLISRLISIGLYTPRITFIDSTRLCFVTIFTFMCRLNITFDVTSSCRGLNSASMIPHCVSFTACHVPSPRCLPQISYALAAQSSTNVNLFFIALALLPGKMIFFFIRRTTNSYLQILFPIWHLQMLYMLPSPPKLLLLLLLLLLLHRLISYNLYIEHYYLHCFKILISSLEPT